MRKYSDTIIDLQGNVVSGASVTVYLAGTTTKASLYSANDITKPLANPVSTDASGSIEFYADNNRYDLVISGTGLSTTTKRDVLLFDPAGFTVGPFVQSGTTYSRDITAKLKDVVSVKDFGAVCDGVTDDTAAIQAAINAVAQDTTIAILGICKISSTINLRSRVHLVGPSRFSGGILGDFDGPLLLGSSQMWRNSFRNLSFKNNYAGTSVGCIKGTFYQGSFRDCQFESNNGFGLYLDGVSYCAGNIIAANYFYYCAQPVYAPGGASYKNTDAWVIDNEFYGTTATTNHLYWVDMSGGVFRGNHFYGAASGYYIDATGGVHVDIDGNYFESHTNARIRLTLGNPANVLVRGNRFWGGDGSGVDLNGNAQSIINVVNTAFASQRVNIIGNAFEGGTNSCNLVATNLDNTTNGCETHVINLDTSNMVRGSYILGRNVHRVDCTLKVVDRVISTAAQTSGISGSVERYTYTGASTDTVSLLSNSAVYNRTWKLYNDTTSTTVTLAPVNSGQTCIGSKRIYPGDVVEITNKNGTYYFNKIARGPVQKIATASRPTLGIYDAGFMYFDTTLAANGKPVFWTGTAYVDSTGAAV